MRNILQKTILLRNELWKNTLLENLLGVVDLIDPVVIRLAGAGDQDRLNYL